MARRAFEVVMTSVHYDTPSRAARTARIGPRGDDRRSSRRRLIAARWDTTRLGRWRSPVSY